MYHIKWDLALELGLLWVGLYLFHRYLGIWAIWGNCAEIHQIMCRDTWKVIQSLQLLVSHQVRLYSVSGPSVGRAIPVSQVLGYWSNLAKLGLNTLNHVQGQIKSNPKSSAYCLNIKWEVTQCRGPLWVELYLFHRCSGIGAIWVNWARIPQIMCRKTWKVIQSLQLLVSHQMRPYSSVRALCELSYTCFTGTRVLGQFWKTGPEYPKSCAGTHET